MDFKEIIETLHSLKDARKIEFKQKKFGINATNSLGIYHKDLSMIAKNIGHDKALAIQLYESGIYEARLLCSKILKPSDVTDFLMEAWVVSFENWEICDSFCMGLFAKSELAVEKILQWTDREPEFEKRAGFTTMAAYCMADKKAPDEQFELFLSIIINQSTDDRLYVKKAVNWALRNIGKRNVNLREKAIETAQEIMKINTPTAKWIAKNALLELTKKNVRTSGYPR